MAQQQVWEFKEMVLAYSASGGIAGVQLYTDMPGGAMAARLGGKTIPNTGGVRDTAAIPLDAIEGTVFYPEITPASNCVLRLFSGIVRARPIGIYLDGALGEKWSTAPIPLGA